MSITRILFISVFFASGCAWKVDAIKTPLIVDMDVRSAYFDYEMTMRKVRTPLEFDSGETANNCKEFFKYRTASTITENSRNFEAAQEYVICETIQVIRQSEKNQVAIHRYVDFSDDLIKRLDLRSFRSSLFQHTDEERYTLDKLFPRLHKATFYSVQPKIEDWNYHVQIVARIDANNSGREDWLIWVKDSARSGSYNTLQALIAYDVEEDGLIRLSSPKS